MKKLFNLLFIVIFTIIAFVGCNAGSSQLSDNQQSTADKDTIDEQTSGEQISEAQEEAAKDITEAVSGTTLEKIRKAVEDSGYTIYGDSQLVFLSEIKDGFSVEITAESQSTVYSFVECNTEEAAIQNAMDIDNAGYSIAIRDGRFLTCYSVDRKDGVIKDILSSLLQGKSVDRLLYESTFTEPAQEVTADPQTTDTKADTVLSEQTVSDSMIGTWASGAISGQYNADTGIFEEVSGMGLIYEFHADGTFAQLIVFGDYIVTTGKYSVDDETVILTDRVSLESSDNGQTWGEKQALPDTSGYYRVESDDLGKYLLLGQEGATLPLEVSVNAMKFNSIE